MRRHRLDARIVAVAAIVVAQLGMLTAVLDARLGSPLPGWAGFAEMACFLAAAAIGLVVRRHPAGRGGTPLDT